MGTHPIFESDFDCLTDMGKRNRKALSAILDGGTSSLPVKTQTVKNSEKTSKKPVTAKIEKSKKDEDFENFLKEEDPELLEFAQNDWDLSDQSDDEADETEKSDQNLDDSAGFASDFSDEPESDMEFDGDLELPSDEEMDVDSSPEEKLEMQKMGSKHVTKEKIEKWIRQLENGNFRALLPASQALWAAIFALDDNVDEVKNKENQKMARGMVANVELFPSLCSVALDHIPPFLIKHFGINKETKAGQIPQHSAWKRCKTGVTIIMKGYLILLDRLVDSSAKSKLLTIIRLMTVFFPAA